MAEHASRFRLTDDLGEPHVDRLGQWLVLKTGNPKAAEGLKQSLASGPHRLMGMLDGPDLVAACVFWGEEPEIDIDEFIVDPERRQQGLGTRFMSLFLNELRDWGLSEVHLEVAEDNAAALALYRSSGFQETSRRKDYYGPGRDALRMILDLQA